MKRGAEVCRLYGRRTVDPYRFAAAMVALLLFGTAATIYVGCLFAVMILDFPKTVAHAGVLTSIGFIVAGGELNIRSLRRMGRRV